MVTWVVRGVSDEEAVVAGLRGRARRVPPSPAVAACRSGTTAPLQKVRLLVTHTQAHAQHAFEQAASIHGRKTHLLNVEGGMVGRGNLGRGGHTVTRRLNRMLDEGVL